MKSGSRARETPRALRRRLDLKTVARKRKMQTPIPISICILAKNCERKIGRCLDRLDRFDDIVVLDTGSTDKTLEILRGYDNVRVFHQDGILHFGDSRNRLTERAKHEWVMHVDSDEYLSRELVDDLVRHYERDLLRPDTVYLFRRRMFYRNKPLPPFDDWIKRLYNREMTTWSSRAVHEVVVVGDSMTTAKIHKEIEHHSYDSVEQLIEKAQMYSSLFADQFHSGRKATALTVAIHGGFSFFKHYFLRGCILYGYDGLVVSVYLALSSFLKYAKIIERNQDRAP